MKYVYLISISICFLFSSCIDILEELILNKDGSGQYTYTIDLSAALKNETIKGLVSAGSPDENPFKDVDTTFYGKDLSTVDKGDKAAIWDKVVTKVAVSEKEEKYIISMKFPFANLSEVGYVLKHMDKAMGGTPLSKKTDSPGMTNDFGEITYSLNGKTLTRKTSGLTAPPQSEEDLSMASMLFADAKYTVIYQLPGKIRKTNIHEASVSGKTVNTSMLFSELMKGKISLDGTIRFK